MSTERLDSRDRLLLAAVALIATVSIFYTILNYQAAFPEASLDLRFSKAQITSLAEGFLREQGLSTRGFRSLTLFDPDEQARIYLERQLGLADANRLMQGSVAVWRWRARWFRPPDQEEMLVYLSPAGALVGFSHVIPESSPGARLPREAARRVAAGFLAGRTRVPQRLIEEQSQDRPARTDYTFTWEQDGFRAGDATYRRSVVVQGDRIGSYSEYLYVPEKWKRDFATLRSSNDFYSQIASVLYILLALAAVAVLIHSIRRRVIHWRPLLVIAASVGGLMVVSEWNSIPFAIDSMPTSSPYSQSLLRALLLGLGAGVGVFFYVILAAAPGEPLYRTSQPSRLSLASFASLGAIRSKEFFVATVVGYGFAALHIAFVVAFYLAGRRFGVWSPQDYNYSDFLSTKLPWIYPLTISLLASTSEEFWFRLLAVPLLKKYLRSTWLAVLIPAFLWGFLHANYPQQPGYIRGLEVGIIGVAAGFLMLRFGILATLVWHYTVDAVLIGMFLFQAESWYFRISGWLVGGAVVFPLLVSIFFYRKYGGFLASPELLNSWQPPRTLEAAPAPPQPSPVAPAKPGWPVWWLYAAALLVALSALVVPRPSEYGDFIKVRVSRGEAEAAAAEALRSRAVDRRQWHRATVFQSRLSTAEFEYLRRVQGRKANDTVRDRMDTGVWMVRYFQPLRKEEWRVWVDQRREVVRVDHLLDEKAPGARLPAEQARQIAEAYLSQGKGIALAGFRLVDSSMDGRDQRTDHTFVWEDPSFRVADARARIAVDVAGSEVSSFRRFLKLPEEWLREFHKPRLIGLVLPAALGAAGMLLLVIFILRLGGRDAAVPRHYRWRRYAVLGGAGTVVRLLLVANHWPSALAGYGTTTPFARYLTGYVLTQLVLALAFGFLLCVAALAADVFVQDACGGGAPPSQCLRRSAAIFLLLWGALRIDAFVGERMPGPRLSLPLWQLPGADTYLPALNLLGQNFLLAVLIVCALAMALGAAARHLGPRGRWALLVAAGAVFAAARDPLGAPQFTWGLTAGLAAAGIIWGLVRICGADLKTYTLALFWLFTAGPAATLIGQPAPVLRWNGFAAALAAIAAGLLFARRRES
ncbi:MAG: CPBP family intramembrane glutamic endopeptidase [Bryobacteraceae bacterium]